MVGVVDVAELDRRGALEFLRLPRCGRRAVSRQDAVVALDLAVVVGV
jgi:hypothetical protein